MRDFRPRGGTLPMSANPDIEPTHERGCRQCGGPGRGLRSPGRVTSPCSATDADGAEIQVVLRDADGAEVANGRGAERYPHGAERAPVGSGS